MNEERSKKKERLVYCNLAKKAYDITDQWRRKYKICPCCGKYVISGAGHELFIIERGSKLDEERARFKRFLRTCGKIGGDLA